MDADLTSVPQFQYGYQPAASQQTLPVDLDAGLARDLMSRQVRVVRTVDEVVRHRLVHIIAQVQLVSCHNGVVF